MGKLANPFSKTELNKLSAKQKKALETAVRKHIKSSPAIKSILREKMMPHYQKHMAAAAKSK
jgi:hypothetical protein